MAKDDRTATASPAKSSVRHADKGWNKQAWDTKVPTAVANRLRDYASYRHTREPKREPFHVDADGPYFRDRQMNRDGHQPFGKGDK